MPDIGAPELMLVLLITLLVFGGSKVADIGGSLGKSIKEFKKAINDDEPAATTAAAPVAAPAATVVIAAPGAVLCPRCHVANLPAAQYCNECGSAMTAPAIAPAEAGTVPTA
jgi:sec-independent protein translocase protein TatA